MYAFDVLLYSLEAKKKQMNSQEVTKKNGEIVLPIDKNYQS
jgi:hypothetical protein